MWFELRCSFAQDLSQTLMFASLELKLAYGLKNIATILHSHTDCKMDECMSYLRYCIKRLWVSIALASIGTPGRRASSDDKRSLSDAILICGSNMNNTKKIFLVFLLLNAYTLIDNAHVIWKFFNTKFWE